jgi:hypothetical protein
VANPAKIVGGDEHIGQPLGPVPSQPVLPIAGVVAAIEHPEMLPEKRLAADRDGEVGMHFDAAAVDRKLEFAFVFESEPPLLAGVLKRFVD